MQSPVMADLAQGGRDRHRIISGNNPSHFLKNSCKPAKCAAEGSCQTPQFDSCSADSELVIDGRGAGDAGSVVVSPDSGPQRAARRC
ncbi:hypothetical protein CCHR01_07619 [Colletotrichum chrysophilum]|uniref:Uncharacterized protein n=1 Tax=Colletotrichum chrysophilum TaxID=1836956 RepID=A0AAD9AKN6_9PEZI|nr:hypothetical protein CCHR01_07619 [Colletotrichum chrysophilum]